MSRSSSILQAMEDINHYTSLKLFQIYVGHGISEEFERESSLWMVYHCNISYIYFLLSTPTASSQAQALICSSLLTHSVFCLSDS